MSTTCAKPSAKTTFETMKPDIKKAARRFGGVIAAIAIIAAISLAFFYPDAIEGRVLNQHDIQQGMANSAEVNAYKDATGQTSWWTNSLFGGMPTYQISPSYSSGTLFHWLNSVYGLWLPEPANYLAMMMIGMLILLLALKVKPPLALTGAVAWGLSSYFVIIIGAGHIWKLITLTYVPPTIAGLVLIYNGRRLLGAALAALFMMLQISGNHVQMSYYFAFVMAGLVIAYGIDAIRHRRATRWATDTAILAGAMMLAVAANAPNLYHTYNYSKHTMRGAHSELTSGADAANATSGLDRDYITAYSYGKGETLSLLIPDIQGGASAKPAGGGMQPLTLADTHAGKEMMRKGGEMALLQLFSQYFGGAEGTNGPVYVGAIIVALFIFGAIVVRGPMKWALVVLTLLSIFLAWGRNMQWFTDLFIDYVPMYSKFRTVESILVIAEFCMPLLAILGLRALVTSANPKTMVKPLAISFGACAAMCLLVILFPSITGALIMTEGDTLNIQRYIAHGALPADFAMEQFPSVLTAAEALRSEMVTSDALRSLLFVGAGAVALMFFAAGKLPKAGAIAVVGIAVLIDLYSADKRYLDHDSFTAPVASELKPTAADLAVMRDTTHYRVLDATRFYAAAPSAFHHAVGGYHAAKLTRYQDLIDRHLGFVARPEAAQLLKLRTDSAMMAQYRPDELAAPLSDLRVLDMLNTRYVITAPDAAPTVNEGALGNAWFVDSLTYVDGADAEMAALDTLEPARAAVADRKFAAALGTPAPADTADRIELTAYAPDALTYRAESKRGGLAVFSEIYYPEGWIATIDGKEAEIGRVNYVLRALAIPAGTHEVAFEFRPQSVAKTNAVATVAVILVYLLLIAGIVKKPRDVVAEKKN